MGISDGLVLIITRYDVTIQSWVLFKVIFYFPNRKSTIWGIYTQDFLFFGNPLSKSKNPCDLIASFCHDCNNPMAFFDESRRIASYLVQFKATQVVIWDPSFRGYIYRHIWIYPNVWD